VENTNLTPEQAIEKINASFEEKSATFSTKNELENATNDLKSQIESLKGLEEKSSDLEKSIAKFEGKLEGFSEKAQIVPAKKLNLADSLMKAFSDNIEDIKSAVEKGGKINLSIKDTSIVGSYTGDYALTDFDSQVDRTVRKRVGILDILSRGTTTSKFVTYVQQTAASVGGWTKEADSKEESGPTWSEISEEVKKIATYVKVSKEMLEDLSFIRAEINNDLMEAIREGVEIALLNGSGVGGQINGLFSIPMGLPAFAPGTFALSIPNANISDLLRVVKAQIEKANFSPTHVILNPEDIAKIQLTKGSDNTYTYPMYLPMTGEMSLAGMKIVSSTYMTAGKYLVGDMSRVNVRFRNDINMSIGLDQDDFSRNMVTILAEARLVQYVKNNQKLAFVVGDIDTDITAITQTP
jgi:HK97 family phage major capsid protein